MVKVPAVLLALALTVTALAPQRALRICIDPGHPSEVGRGTRGKLITELEVAWLVGLEMKRLLEAQGVQVKLTKTKMDEMVRNKRRAEIANAFGADLLIRLHLDAATGRGFGTYYPDRQGKAQGVVGPSKEVLQRSRAAAAKFHPATIQALNGLLRDRGLKTDRATAIGAKQGALTGSIFSKVPVILVEMAVLTNPEDEKVVAGKKGRDAVAKAMVAGIRAVFAPAPKRK